MTLRSGRIGRIGREMEALQREIAGIPSPAKLWYRATPEATQFESMAKTVIKRVRRGDSAARLYEAIRSRILSMTFAPGAAIDEAALVREFQVSRTPVREAVVRLASEGLVNLLPNKGAQVAPLDLSRIRDYLEAIDLVQRAVTALAAKRRPDSTLPALEVAGKAFEDAAGRRDSKAMVERNRDFHLVINRACGNELLMPTYSRLLDEGLRISRFTLSDLFYQTQDSYRGFVDHVVEEHRQMIDAIRDRDAAAAEQAAKAHTDHTRARFSEFLFEGFSLEGSVI
jgi:DNA-binding GntR family transcriptional regulator